LASSSTQTPEAVESAADSTSSAQTIARFDRYVIGNYRRFPVSLVRGEGSWVWDAEGRKYLDLFPGWGCNLLGHCPPRVVQAVQDQVASLIHVPNTWYMDAQGRFAEALSTRSFGGQAFFCNSGAEANEAALKLARAHGHHRGKFKIVTMYDGFHGRTYGAVSATAQPKYHAGFEPIVPGFIYVPFNDVKALEQAVDAQTAAVLFEPIQGEGGVHIAADGYLEAARAVCDHHGALLVLDEVQTGMGRTGKWFGYQHSSITPDIITLAKALAGGIAAGAMLARPEVAASLKPGMHASTFGGNPIACRAGLATIDTIEAENLLPRAGEIGCKFFGHFQALASRFPGLIKEIRIRGVMIGLEFTRDVNALVAACMTRGLLINVTHNTVVRLLPSLGLTDAEIDQGAQILEQAVADLSASVSPSA
jgi:predicted acetylornithine/succinylornithine family transaminase